MPTPQPSRQATALIVDDDHVMRLLEYETLSQFDFAVHEANDAHAALDLLSTLVPDLLLLDVDMPGMNGFELCRRVRQRWDMTRLPIIMVTGMDDLESINEAYQSGANDFVSKPINWPILGHRARYDRARYVLRSAQAVRELHELKEKQAAIVQAIPDTIFLTDRRGTYLDFKAGFGATPGLAPGAIVDRHVAEILPGEVAELVLRAIEPTLQEGRIESLVYKLPLADGTHHYEARLAPSGADKVVIVVRDITLQKLNEDRVRRLAYFDTLTGMPNRQSFLERLDDELLRARRQGRVVALLFLDLDGFKRVNDTLGHSAGDQLLQAVAEDSGLIVPLGEWVMRTACRQLVEWLERGAVVPRVAVNVSATQVRGADFIGTVASVIDETGIGADQLELELTESILMDPDMRRIEGLSRLRARGVHFSIDDSGTGYSPLSYVKRFPISMLKIDQSFVRGLPDSANDAGITTAIIAMARSLGLEVIAEGVENACQADFLRRAQCDKLQGYLFSRPLQAAEVEQLLLQGRL
ncbi:MAG TPA: GGDEF domain-containing protein [Candidatus Accumulibacter sp.]|nr:MAG: Oxygen sensor protein DosP [Candidatus Accumulibacter sp. SK-11]HAY28204.1 GGDEF domain-containing protein [Accumulibacter sp.]HCN68277.1 GGDEF domain-containing protein [Accumulibacter sp.]HRL78124.1 EAL domain-containing protein [Candidatus Accumulibacter phosphatis]